MAKSLSEPPADRIACGLPASEKRSPSFRDALLGYLTTGAEADLHAASAIVAALLKREDTAGCLQALTAVHGDLEASLVDPRGRRALDLVLAINTPILMMALSAPPAIRALDFETAERQSLEEDVRAATLALARERELLEDRVAARTADLMAAKANLQTIVFLASHDLRTPANAIELSTRVLAEEMETTDSDQARALVAEIGAAARRILGRLHAFVELNRLEDRREDAVPVDFKALVHAVWQTRDAPSAITLQTAIDIDSARLEAGIVRAIVEELVDNALAHGGPTLSTIAVRIRREQASILLDVADDGRGVPTQARQRIMRPFETLGPANADRDGNGVGLALVDKLLQLRGGMIRCDSDPILGGARFRILIP